MIVAVIASGRFFSAAAGECRRCLPEAGRHIEEALLRVVGVATGTRHPDALVASPALASRGRLLLLTGEGPLAEATRRWLEERQLVLPDVWLFGGLSAISDEAVRRSPTCLAAASRPGSR